MIIILSLNTAVCIQYTYIYYYILYTSISLKTPINDPRLKSISSEFIPEKLDSSLNL